MTIARHKLRLLSATTLIIAAIVTWINIDSGATAPRATNIKTKSAIDFFVKDAAFKSFDLNGQLSQTVSAIKIEHYSQQQYSIAQTIRASKYKEQQLEASITSRQATIFDTSITFEEQVKVSVYENDIETKRLDTAILVYDHIQQNIQSEALVEFTDILGNTVTATGLSADIRLQSLDLKSNVKGIINAN